MKKLLYAVAAFAVLFTSCAKDDVVTPVEDKEALVSFCVNSPAVATRYGEGEKATALYYAVYDANGLVEAISKIDEPEEIKLSTTVDLRLIQGREYDVLFWAADAQAPYEVDWDAKTMTVKDVLTANQESYDAFFKYESLGEVSGALSKTIELRRPFAQLNIATGDTTDAGKAEFVVSQTAVTVENVYKTLNFVDGTVSNEDKVVFDWADKANGKITANNNEYDHIAMNYLLVGEKKLVNVTLGINNEVERKYSSVPVQRNYRTNIVGNILTSPAQFNVVILPGFEENEHPFTDEDKLAMAAQTSGDYTLTEDVDLTAPIEIPAGVKFELNLNGYTVTTNDTDGYAIMNNGTLIIKDVPVSTRNTTNNCEINGIVYTGENATTTVDGGVFNALDGGAYVFLNSKGTLIINNATINGGSSYPVYSYNENSKLVINNAIVNASFGCINSYGLGSQVEINGGTFNMTGVQGKTSHIAYFSNGDVTINGGSFNKIGDINMSAAGGGGICAIYGANLTIKGGNIAGDYADVYNWGGTNSNGRATAISIQGGTFKFNPTAFVAAGYKAIEKDGKYVVVANEVDAVVSTAAEFTTALSEGGNILLQENINITKLDLTNLTNDVVIDANGKTITTASNYGVQVTAGKNIKLKNAKVEMTVKGDYITYAAGLKIENGDYQGKTISLENCEIRMCNTDWAYAVNMPASVKNLNLVINGCTLEGALAVQCWGDNNTITITNSNLICNYTTSAMYTSYCVALQGDGTNNSENNTLNISGCAFSYSGVDNYNSTIKAVYNHKHNGANTITVDNCTYGEKVKAY